MDVAKIVKEQRDMILQKYGFQIKIEKVEEDNNSSYYQYTITTRKDGGFVATIKRMNKDELDNLLSIIYYMDSVSYKVSYARAEAYDDCVQTSPYPHYKVVNKSIEANKIEVEQDYLDGAGLIFIENFQIKGILGLEKSRKTLPELYSELKWLKETAAQKQVDYESVIPAEVRESKEDLEK